MKNSSKNGEQLEKLLPDVDERKIVKNELRKMWMRAKERKQNIWAESKEMRAKGVPYEERVKHVQKANESLSQLMSRLEKTGKQDMIRSLGDVVKEWESGFAHAQKNPEDFIRRYCFLFIYE